MTVNDCYLVGYVVKPHGTKGGVLARIDADDPQSYIQMESVLVEQPEGLVPFFIEDIEPASQSGHLIIYFDEVQTIEEAQKMKSVRLYAPLEDLPELDQDQFYYHEVVGYEVEDATHGVIGTLKEVQELPSNTLLVVAHEENEVLIPLKEPIYTGIDKAARKLFVNCPDGLLEIYRNEN